MAQKNLQKYFSRPQNPRQKLYEAIRAIVVDEREYKDVSRQYGYKVSSLYSYIQKAKNGVIELFPELPTKARGRSAAAQEVREQIINYRKKEHLSAAEISIKLDKKISAKTVERLLKEAGFSKLKKRTHKERGITSKNKLIPEVSSKLDFENMLPVRIDCPVVGIYFFIPYLLELGIIDIIKQCELPGSSVISNVSACLSMLALKLIGHERLGTMDNYDAEPGLGFFAGLSLLPKATYMCTYSCRTSEQMLLNFQKQLLQKFMTEQPELYGGDCINLDFHSIPHYGTESEMEKVWCGAKHQALKGANTVFAQDNKNNMVLYTRVDILRKEETLEVKKFVDYYKSITKEVTETLVFDCKFTSYEILNDLATDNIHFVTLRKRNAKLLENVKNIPKDHWVKMNLNIPKRKHKKIKIYEQEIKLTNCTKPFRQIIVKDHGRDKPTFVITNNKNLSAKDILMIYAKRWRIENKISELVTFFNLNALSSPLMIRIHFDLLWTLIADTLYHRFAQDLRRFEHHDAKTIFRKFINMPGQIIYDGENFTIKIRKRSHTPILKSVEKLTNNFTVPWLDNKKVNVIWAA